MEPTPSTEWLTVIQGEQPLVVSLPHTGTDLPPALEPRLASPWLARKDTDWWIDRLYDFAVPLGATVIRTTISRTVIDVNRDPSGVSLYPGQATTELCPTTTFDGESLYKNEAELTIEEIADRRRTHFDPYHRALAAEIARLRGRHPRIVVYDCHSIRSVIPRLFEGELPNFNIGTNDGKSCDPRLTRAVEAICDRAAPTFTRVTNGRFKGGYITRHYGRPTDDGVHAIQMELACRGYLVEPLGAGIGVVAGAVTPSTWPVPYDEARAAPMREILTEILTACLAFVEVEP
jgi:N-formylglutamate deformylase